MKECGIPKYLSCTALIFFFSCVVTSKDIQDVFSCQMYACNPNVFNGFLIEKPYAVPQMQIPSVQVLWFLSDKIFI